MSFPQIVEVVIGLILIYCLMGAIISMLTQIVMESLQVRGLALERYLKRIAGDKAPDLINLPQIKALRPVRYGNWWNVFGAGAREKKVEKIPVDLLVDAYFDMIGLTSKGSLNITELTNLISKLPESEGKRAMLVWIQQGVTALSDLRNRTRAYFTGMLNQAALAFRARARSFVILSSIALTLLIGSDSLQIASELWTDAGLRNLATQQAQISASQLATDTEVEALLDQLGTLSLRIDWWWTQTLPATSSQADLFNIIFLKIVGLGITTIAVSQGSSFWYDLLRKITRTSWIPSVDPPDGGSAAG